MNPLPTKPVWYLVGRTGEGDMKSVDMYWTPFEAQTAREQKEAESNELVYTVEESESIIPDRTLPSREQIVRIGDFLHRAFVVLRFISYGRTNFEAIERLTDILHNLPTEMFDAERWDWNFYIHGLRNFKQEFPDVQTMNLAATLEDIRDSAKQVAVGNPH